MNCKEVQTLIPKYIDGTISDTELEEFLSHISSCDMCYEELEITYIIKEALVKIDENPNAPFNIRNMLKKKLKASENYIKRMKKFHSCAAGIYVTAELSLMLVVIIQLCVWFTNGLWVF